MKKVIFVMILMMASTACSFNTKHDNGEDFYNNNGLEQK